MLKVSIALGLGLATLWGFYLLDHGIGVVRQSSASARWPKVQGVVVRSDDIRKGVAVSARAIVRYTAGDGKEYSTDLISFGQTMRPFDRDEAGLQLVRYPDGSKAAVSYNPNRPWIAILHPGPHSEAFWPIGLAAAVLLPVLLCWMKFPAVVRNLERNAKASKTVREMAGRGAPRSAQMVTPAPLDGELPSIPGQGISAVTGAIAAAIFASLFCGLGVLALSSGLQKMYYGYGSRTWPTTTGEVIVNVGPEAMMQRQNKGDYTIYPPGFLYRYEVAGARHVNSIVHFRSVKNTGEVGADEATPPRLPVGTKVSVAYFPADPDISALQPGVDSGMLILPGIGIVMLCMSLPVFIWLVPSLLWCP